MSRVLICVCQTEIGPRYLTGNRPRAHLHFDTHTHTLSYYQLIPSQLRSSAALSPATPRGIIPEVQTYFDSSIGWFTETRFLGILCSGAVILPLCGHVDESRCCPGPGRSWQSISKRHDAQPEAAVFVGISVFPSLNSGAEMVLPFSSISLHIS
jgi:hypothetical protein